MSNIKVTFFSLEHHILYISQDSQEGHCPIFKDLSFFFLFFLHLSPFIQQDSIER